MKFAVVLCIFYCVVVSFGQELDKFQVCVERLNASDEDITTIASLDLPETVGAKKLLSCTMKEMGLFIPQKIIANITVACIKLNNCLGLGMNDDNSLDVEGAMNAFAEIQRDNHEKYDEIIKVIKECEAETAGLPGMDDELTALTVVANCLFGKKGDRSIF